MEFPKKGADKEHRPRRGNAVARRTNAGCRPTRLGYRRIGGGYGEQSTAEFGSECRSLALDFEKNADDLPISRSPQAEAVWFEPLMIEPGPHAIHPVVQIITADRDFGHIEHMSFLSTLRIGRTVIACTAARRQHRLARKMNCFLWSRFL
jgi:hypothetical protein